MRVEVACGRPAGRLHNAKVMMRESKPSKFGPVDPFCWLAVVPLLLVTVPIGWIGLLPIAIGAAIFALGLLVFDSWVNRPVSRADSDDLDYDGPGYERASYDRPARRLSRR
jgi:hypothetical protein